MMTRIVTLFGKVVEPGKWLPFYVFDVYPRLGDAQEFGLAGQIKIHRRQIYGEPHIEPAPSGKDVIRLPAHIAKNLGKDPDEPPPPEKPIRRGRK